MGQLVSVSRVGITAILVATLLELVIVKAWKKIREKPKRPPSPPLDCFGISQEDLIRNAQETLGMDVVNHYNYAVCGPRGTGKSTFINAIRGLDDPAAGDNSNCHDPQKAAPVGITETTSGILSYEYSCGRYDRQYVKFWDVPGSGTVDHPSGTYFRDKVLYAFDSLLIVSSETFGEEQIRLLEEAQSYGTPTVIVITKIDQTVNNNIEAQFKQKRHYHPTLDEYRPVVEQTIEELKLYVQRQQDIVPPARVFVVSAKKFRDCLQSVQAQEWDDAAEDALLTGEIGQLIEHLVDTASHRRH